MEINVNCEGQKYTYAFLLLSPLQNDSILTSWYIQFTIGDKREVYLLDEKCKREK